MTGKIIGKRVVPDVFEVYERDVGTKTVKFSVSKINDGVNFEELDGYAHIDFESGKTDRSMLEKTVDGQSVIYELSITRAITQEEGRHRIQLSFENDDLSVVYKTCIFTFMVCESIDGNLAFDNLVPSVVNELEEKMEQTLLECSNLKDETYSIKNEAQGLLDGIEDFRNELIDAKETSLQVKADVEGCKNEVVSLKTDVETIKGDTLNLKTDCENIKSEVFEAKETTIEARDRAELCASSAFRTLEDTNAVKSEVEIIKGDAEGVLSTCFDIQNNIAIDKDVIYQMKEETAQYKQEAVDACEYFKTNHVTSVNSKTGDVVLTVSDIEGLETAEIKPLYIDGVVFDGKSEVHVYTDKNYQTVTSETCDLHLENKSCVYVKSVSRLNLYSDKLDALSACNCEIYLQISNEMELYTSANFYYYGENCEFGIFKPTSGNYYLRFYKLEKSAKIYVEVKELEYINWNTTIKSGFPVTINYDEDTFTNNVSIIGNVKTEVVNGVETFAYPVCGVGEQVTNENGETKYKIDVITQNANLLSLSFAYDAVDTYSVNYDETLGQFYFTGTTCMDYESVFELDKPIEKGSTIYMNAFNLSSNMETALTSGNVLEFALATDSGDVIRIGIDYLGNPSTVDGYSNMATLTEDVKYFKVKFLERATDTQLDNRIGITISKNAPMEEFKKAELRVASVYIDKPLLKIDKAQDQLYLKMGKVSRLIKQVTIESKSELVPLNDSEDAPAIKKYDRDFTTISSYYDSLWIHGKTLEESKQCVTYNVKHLQFNKDVFGSYNNFDESVFPIRIIYATSQQNESIPLTPMIKVFEGDTTFYISGGEKPSGGYAPLCKK